MRCDTSSIGPTTAARGIATTRFSAAPPLQVDRIPPHKPGVTAHIHLQRTQQRVPCQAGDEMLQFFPPVAGSVRVAGGTERRELGMGQDPSIIVKQGDNAVARLRHGIEKGGQFIQRHIHPDDALLEAPRDADPELRRHGEMIDVRAYDLVGPARELVPGAPARVVVVFRSETGGEGAALRIQEPHERERFGAAGAQDHRFLIGRVGRGAPVGHDLCRPVRRRGDLIVIALLEADEHGGRLRASRAAATPYARAADVLRSWRLVQRQPERDCRTVLSMGSTRAEIRRSMVSSAGPSGRSPRVPRSSRFARGYRNDRARKTDGNHKRDREDARGYGDARAGHAREVPDNCQVRNRQSMRDGPPQSAAQSPASRRAIQS
ncbi:MAG: hypothetical protein HPM95_20965 [Alphaproteobacteria bacterium]|nr:hypothetical protein [Alphaproteobacteria bacterium]